MAWQRYSSGSAFEQRYGYSRVLYDDEWVFVAGTTGFDYSTMTISDDPAEQTRQTLANIEGALAEGGATMADVYNYLIIVDDRANVPAVMDAFAGRFPGLPTGTLIIAGLVEERIKVEIEVRARKARG